MVLKEQFKEILTQPGQKKTERAKDAVVQLCGVGDHQSHTQ